MSGKTILKVLKNLAFLCIGILLLYLAFRGNDLEQLWAEIKEADYLWVAISVLFGFAAYISRAIRWLILLKPLGYNPKLSNSIYSIIIGYFANLAIPRIGEITRCTTLNQTDNVPVDKLFGTVILERIIDLVMLLSLTLITVLLKVDLFGTFFLDLFASNMSKMPSTTSLLIILAILAAGAVFLFWLLRSKLAHWKPVIKIKEFLLGLKEGLVSIRKIENLKGFIFHTLFIWVSYYIMTWIVFFSLPETSHLGLIDGLFILVVGGFGMAAPVQGGIGAFHFVVSMGMTVLGIENSTGLTFATILHTSQTILTLVAGAISLGMIYLTNRKSKNVQLQS